MLKISSRVSRLELSPHRQLVAKVDELLRQGRDVYNYSAGQPGLPPDLGALKEFCTGLINDPFNYSRYVGVRGLKDLKDAIADDLKMYGGIDVDPNNILVTTGGVEAVFLSLNVVTDPGDKILMLDPSYSVYWGLVKYLGLKPVRCSQSVDRGFQPSLECIERAINEEGVAAALVASPDNPTSRVIDEGIAKALVELAVDRGVWVLYDEAYRHIVYEGSHVWMQRFSGAERVVVGLGSFSKDIAIPGFRLGYMYGPKEVIDQAAKLKGYLSITSPVPAQHLALKYLRGGFKESYLKYALSVYRSRRDAAYRALRKNLPKARVWRPNAGMYLFPDMTPYIADLGIDDVRFTYRLAEEKAVVMLPGSIFGESGVNHLRITFVTQPEDRLERGIELLAEFIDELRSR
ncbi:MAG: aspartate aminotransferase [Desulfurococcales archaeon ex4484_204]|nr:MAG: aspartate aminotransferase [Desulfurococcales archaeon ex4484_204]